MAASAVGMIWPRSRSAVQGIGLLGATLYWYRCTKIRSGSGAANADGMAAKNVGLIWPRSRSAMQGIGLLSGIWILVCSNQKCNWSSVCTRNGSIGTWSTCKPISMQQAITVAVSLPLLEFQCANQWVVCAPVQPQVDEGSSFSCGMSVCSNPIASNSSSEMGMASWKHLHVSFFCMSPA